MREPDYEPTEPDEFTEPIKRLRRADDECSDPTHNPILSALPDLLTMLNEVDDIATAHLATAAQCRYDVP
jgi:hypothetical protein